MGHTILRREEGFIGMGEIRVSGFGRRDFCSSFAGWTILELSCSAESEHRSVI